MGTHSPDELLPLYSREEISMEQAIWHILQNLVKMQKLLDVLRRELEAVKKENERLKTFVGMEGA